MWNLHLGGACMMAALASTLVQCMPGVLAAASHAGPRDLRQLSWSHMVVAVMGEDGHDLGQALCT